MPLVWGPHCELRQRMVCEPNPSFPVDGQFASALWILGGGETVGEAEVRTAPSLRGQQCSQDRSFTSPSSPSPGSLVVISAFPGK